MQLEVNISVNTKLCGPLTIDDTPEEQVKIYYQALWELEVIKQNFFPLFSLVFNIKSTRVNM